MTGLTTELIKPARSYKFVTLPNGLAVILEAWPAVRDVEKRMNEGKVITKKEVIKWAKPLPYKVDDDFIDELTDSLNFMRVTVHAKDAIPYEVNDVWQQVGLHFSGLLKHLPTLVSELRKADTDKSSKVAEAFESTLKVVQCVLDHVPFSTLKKSAPWHDDAAFLATLLQNAANRYGKKASVSKGTAPAIKFIDTALERASVPHSREFASIARAMARHKEDVANASARISREGDDKQK